MATQPAPSLPLLPSPIPIPFSILHAVHASDQAMYPVDLPYSRLQAWVDAAADFCLYYPPPSSQAQAPTLEKSIEHGTGSTDDGHQGREQGPASDNPGGGVVVVLPLRRRHWEDLLTGRLKEPEIDPGCMFPPLNHRRDSEAGDGEGEEEEVGLHVYHIERFGDVWLGGAQVSKRPRFSEVALAEVSTLI
ncbi:hypothetical protein VTJ04DRAFT_8862 [Mycothermus thermophilus]|uniref:uncharacterized protein n=1 Tax=Humicola insolens TaxID=85995 RepID=UPI003743DBDA